MNTLADFAPQNPGGRPVKAATVAPAPAASEELSLERLASLGPFAMVKVYQNLAGAWSWIKTLGEVPSEEEIMAGFGPGKFRVSGVYQDGRRAALVELSIAGQRNQVQPAPGGPATVADSVSPMAWLGVLPQLVHALRPPERAPVQQGLSIAEALALFREFQSLAPEPADDPDPAPPVDGLSGLVGALGQLMGGGPGALTPAAVASWIEHPANLAALVDQLQQTDTGQQVLALVRQHLA